MPPTSTDHEPDARSRTFSRTGMVLLVAFGALLLWLAIDLLLLVFAGILAAIFLRSLAVMVSDRTPLSAGWALAAVILALLGVTVGAGFFVAPSLAEQTQELVETLPEAVSEIEQQVRQNRFGNWVLDRALEGASQSRDSADPSEDDTEGRGGPQPFESEQPQEEEAGGEDAGTGAGMEDAQDAVIAQAAVMAPRVMHGIVGLVVVIFTAIYLAANPQPYIRGVLRLFPLARRTRMGEVLYACGYTLQWWLYGQLLAMAVVGLTMGVGLAIIGVPLALVLGVVAGLFEFIPTLGPLLALLPAMALALTNGTDTALWVLGLYSFIQTLESYLLTPLVQQRVVHVPPVVTIAGQIFFTWTLGPMGLLIAVPVIAVTMVVVKMLYVEDFLGDDLEIEAEDEGRAAHDEAAPMETDDEDA